MFSYEFNMLMMSIQGFRPLCLRFDVLLLLACWKSLTWSYLAHPSPYYVWSMFLLVNANTFTLCWWHFNCLIFYQLDSSSSLTLYWHLLRDWAIIQKTFQDIPKHTRSVFWCFLNVLVRFPMFPAFLDVSDLLVTSLIFRNVWQPGSLFQ